MSFPVAFNTTGPLASGNIDNTGALASGDNRDEEAPPTSLGDNNNNDAFGGSVEDARAEPDTARKRLREIADDNAVSPEEARKRRPRRVAVESTVAQASYGIANAGVEAQIFTLTANNATALANLTAVFTAKLTNLTTDLTNQIACLTARIDGLGNLTAAQFANVRARSLNKFGTPWTPLQVERVGANPVGVLPAIFPASAVALISMTGHQITALQEAFNLPAGYFDGPTLADRREAVREYIMTG